MGFWDKALTFVDSLNRMESGVFEDRLGITEKAKDEDRTAILRKVQSGSSVERIEGYKAAAGYMYRQWAIDAVVHGLAPGCGIDELTFAVFALTSRHRGSLRQERMDALQTIAGRKDLPEWGREFAIAGDIQFRMDCDWNEALAYPYVQKTGVSIAEARVAVANLLRGGGR